MRTILGQHNNSRCTYNTQCLKYGMVHKYCLTAHRNEATLQQTFWLTLMNDDNAEQNSRTFSGPCDWNSMAYVRGLEMWHKILLQHSTFLRHRVRKLRTSNIHSVPGPNDWKWWTLKIPLDMATCFIFHRGGLFTFQPPLIHRFKVWAWIHPFRPLITQRYDQAKQDPLLRDINSVIDAKAWNNGRYCWAVPLITAFPLLTIISCVFHSPFLSMDVSGWTVVLLAVGVGRQASWEVHLAGFNGQNSGWLLRGTEAEKKTANACFH